jgi:Competence protein
MKAATDSSLGSRAALWGAPYGVIANLLAMPIVSAWVMPMGLLGLLAIPFGFDAMR